MRACDSPPPDEVAAGCEGDATLNSLVSLDENDCILSGIADRCSRLTSGWT